ncbi:MULTISPECIES: hypothetical protein [Halolamina]|uniref:Uncharacterized protein n=1 Tax=Halolamina pelagica TaxID=699431 RepID=A0A1I5P2V0_9EURY|nr:MULTISPECIES: hypothetical protein [Halolamina]SFP28372.1 hypothetical protein SAMN05216277_102320 [Halolamina pelagica]
MNYRRAVSVLLAVTAATMLVTGSFGFTSVSADRGVSVAVVESENAYVGVSVCEKDNGTGNGSDPVKVTVTNRFSEPFTVDEISWSDSAHQSKDRLNPKKGTLAPGESRTFNKTFGEQEVTVEVTGGLDATVTAEVGDRCNSANEEGTGTPTETATPTSNETATETATPTPDTTETPTPTDDA